MYEFVLIIFISLDFKLHEDKNPVYFGFHGILMAASCLA